jgi:hypothetical protein
MSVDATEAANRLAEVLTSHAPDLASDQLTVVVAAMTEVAAAAHALQESLSARGWSWNVLRGLEDPIPFEDDLDDDDLDDDEATTVPDGIRMTYQARHDFVVTDEEALIAHLERRYRDAGWEWDRDEIVQEGAFTVFITHHDLAVTEPEGFGLAYAGGQSAIYEISRTLWEMDFEERDDQHPLI